MSSSTAARPGSGPIAAQGQVPLLRENQTPEAAHGRGSRPAVRKRAYWVPQHPVNEQYRHQRSLMAKTVASSGRYLSTQPVGLSYADTALKRKGKQGSWTCILFGGPRLQSETLSQKEKRKKSKKGGGGGRKGEGRRGRIRFCRFSSQFSFQKNS